MTSNSLKIRIVKAAFAMTFIVCLIFSTGIFLIFDMAEETLFEEHQQDDINTFIAHYARYPDLATLPRDNFEVYVTPAGDRTSLPEYLRVLEPGVDDIYRDGRTFDLEVRRHGNRDYYFVTEETASDRLEYILLISVSFIVLVICIVSIFLSFTFAGSIIKPVTELADRVNNLENTDPGNDSGSTAGMDEISVLSSAIDSYSKRVALLLEREREFSSDASHELRTPLMGIQAAAENLQVSETSPRVLELAGRIESRCRHMQSLIESMLYLARDPDSLENDFSSIKLAEVIRDQVEAASPLLTKRKMEVNVSATVSPAVQSTTAIVSVVFGNLLRNAIVHSESSEVAIELFNTGFIIRDFGSGIPADVQERMFERYAHGNGNTSNGFGIGLSLVKRLCDHFGWELQVDSNEQTGTIVTVSMPG